MITHRPSGTMCSQCRDKNKSCGWLPFETMQVIRLDKDGTKVVKCSNYQKETKETT